MSWSQSFNSRAALEADTPDFTSGLDGDAPWPREQAFAAREAALALLASGYAGGSNKDFTVTLSGHANPQHEPADGWANDCITVSVTQKSAAQ